MNIFINLFIIFSWLLIGAVHSFTKLEVSKFTLWMAIVCIVFANLIILHGGRG
ncbi:hypothetical protein MUB24_06255 [Lederbergia sp. NSJ-179]|uniref:hypothetical protein n=1 Tax=Lederbergia sp. NSJ-179 TaxID=2931402 RepID=UPI001FCFE362|nr:hypothetical protein [Lederbergia sp. NSJ-179]MCJ7840529.1 hypothetical protein [Lederbergia sp. NSJ-179]